jgi:hypothetical protein
MASIISAGTTSGTALNMAGDTSGILQLATNGSTTAITIDASQNVGIGTTNPTVPLVTDGSGVTGGQIQIRRSNVLQGNIYGTGSAFRIENTSSTPIVFIQNTGTEYMRIDSNGTLLIGTTNTDPTFNRVNGLNLLAQGRIYSRANGSWDIGRDVTSGIHMTFYTDNGSARVGAGNISSNGSTTAYNTSSDYRLKENVITISNALETITQLKPVKWTWKDGFGGTKTEGQGFIAHELQAIVPECVTGEKDAVETYTDEEGNEQTRPAYQGVDTSFLVATLTAAIQEQQTIINDLKARVTALEGAA